jgi:exopolysaccharide biosynthesis predicted pyruvyltransferase EpsI
MSSPDANYSLKPVPEEEDFEEQEEDEFLIEVADDTNRNLVGDEMGTENFFSQNRVIKLKSMYQGSKRTISTNDRFNQSISMLNRPKPT